MTWPTDNISLAVKGESLFGDTLTIGSQGNDVNRTGGTFWGNWNGSLSTFNGLYVHGEIHNERIPENLYTSAVINNEVVPNEFADKFFVNSSIATATATYRGVVTPEDYNPKTVNVAKTDPELELEEVDLTDPNTTESFPLYYLDQDVKKIYKVTYSENIPINETIIEEKGIQENDTIYVWYTFEDNGGQEINPNDWDQMSTWLNTHVLKYADSNTVTAGSYNGLPKTTNKNRCYHTIDDDKYYQYDWVNDHWPAREEGSNNPLDNDVVDIADWTKLPIPELIAASENRIYHVKNNDEDKYYQWIQNIAAEGSPWEYVEVSAVPDKNDYCYVQIWEPDTELDYVLFSDIYDFEDNNIRPDTNAKTTDEERKKIICHRYKFVQITHPTTEEVIEETWRFEY